MIKHFQAKQLDIDPRACIGSFFDRIQVADLEYKKHFDLEVESFKERIKKRALEKIEEALAEQEVRTFFVEFCFNGQFLIANRCSIAHSNLMEFKNDGNFQEEERQARLGPGGLDPVEVFETLPEVKTFTKLNHFIDLLF